MKRNRTMKMSRRDVLKAAGTGAVAMAIPAALAVAAAEKAVADLRAKAKKNLKLAIFASVYADLPLDEATRRIKEDGFAAAVLETHFKDVHFDPFAPDWSVARKITAAFERHGVQIVGVFGYYNVVDPDAARRKRGEERMDLFIRNWKRLGSSIISTETGTFNAQSEWAASPENYTEDGYVRCRTAFEKLARAAEKTGAIITIEPYWRNVIDSAERAERLLREVKSPSLKLVMDPCNYFRNEDLPRMKPMLEDMFKRLGSQIVIAHAKDVKATPNGQELPAAGLGVLDYPLYLRLLAGLDREMHLVIEHLTLKDVARARDFVKAQMDKI